MGTPTVSEESATEQSVSLWLWLGDGALLAPFQGDRDSPVEVSVGRTDSKRAIGFRVTGKGKNVLFVLNREQVELLSNFLDRSVSRLKPPRRTNGHAALLLGGPGKRRKHYLQAQKAASRLRALGKKKATNAS